MVQTTRFTLLIVLAAAFAGASACKQAPKAGNAATAQNAAAPVAENIVAAVPVPQPPMDRPALLDAVASARSAAAAGIDDRNAQQQLDGKEFELRIRFGCSGPASGAAKSPTLGWSLDRKGAVLRVHATPNLSNDDPEVAAMALQGVEAVEGFWLQRPWLLQATCPAEPTPESIPHPRDNSAPAPKSAGQPPAPPPVPAAPKVGIAQFFTASDPRTARRDDRPYEAVQKLDSGATIGQQGFDLVLSGRLRMLAGGRVIRCVPNGTDAPPACVIAATFDHVWIEDAASRRRIADWSSS